MKKALFMIPILFLCALFLITACDSPAGILPQETTDTETETPVGSDPAPDETTAEIEDESTAEEVTTVPEYFETFAPELREELLQWLKEDPGVRAYCERYPEIFDLDLSYCVSSDVFESLLADRRDDYITFDELTKIVGKPHLRSNLKLQTVLYIWITSERTTYAFLRGPELEHPEDLSMVEITLHYSRWRYFSGSANDDAVTTTAVSELTTESP